MFISIWNYLRGYVMIEVSGFSVERFLNLAAHRGIYIWDIERQGTKINIKVGISGYKMLKECARKTGCRMKIKKKYGLPFITYRYRKRKMLPIGLFIFVILMYVMSSFVWLVEVKGNERILTQDIIEKLTQSGYTVGGWKYKMNLRNAEQILMRSFPDILWTGVSFEGTKLIVELTETVPQPSPIDYTKPCHIVAKSDALILDIVTRKGTPKVKKGDTVRKGDIIVSSQVPIGDEGEMRYVHASADVLAKTYYTIQTQIGLKKTSKKYTGKAETAYVFRFFKKDINIYRPSIPWNQYDRVIHSKQFQITSKFPMPFYWIKQEYIEYILQPAIISDEVAQDKLTVMLYELLQKNIHENGTIIRQDITFEKQGDIMIGKLHAIVEEELGEEAMLEIDDGRN